MRRHPEPVRAHVQQPELDRVARRPRLGIDRREHRCECLAHPGCDWCRRPERRSVLRGSKCGQQCVCPSITNVRRLKSEARSHMTKFVASFLSAVPTIPRVMIDYGLPKTNMFALVGSGCEGVKCEPKVDWSRVRRARPLDHLLPGTQRWAESLPAASTPAHLVRMYPRVANRLAIAWQDPKAVQEVLEDVLVDRRGGRQGFPPSVQHELRRLAALSQSRLQVPRGLFRQLD